MDSPAFKAPRPGTGILAGFLGLASLAAVGFRWGKPGWWGSEYGLTTLLWGVMGLTFGIMLLLDGAAFREPVRQAPFHSSGGKLLTSAVWRSAVIWASFLFIRYMYLHHPLYQAASHDAFRELAVLVSSACMVFTLPYVLATLRWRGGIRWELTDPALMMLLLGKTLLRAVLFKGSRAARTVVTNRRAKSVMLGLAIHAFFFPIMVSSFAWESNEVVKTLGRLPGIESLTALPREGWHELLTHGIFAAESLVAAIAFFVPLRWTDNRIRSVDPTLTGWVAALLCYHPINRLAGAYIPWPAKNPDWQIIHSPYLREMLQEAGLVCLILFLLSTLSMGLKFSNLSNRGIVSGGTYAWVRHPSYVTLNLYWWLDFLPWMGSASNILGLLGWNAVFAWRACTEERHLRKDPAYRAYCEKTRYRFIPGIF